MPYRNDELMRFKPKKETEIGALSPGLARYRKENHPTPVDYTEDAPKKRYESDDIDNLGWFGAGMGMMAVIVVIMML